MMHRALPVFLLGLLFALPGLAQTAAPGSASERRQHRVLELVNAARSAGRRCGNERFAAAAPLTRSQALARAAQRHASDMARRDFFDHRTPEGAEPRDRARQAGYRWVLIGENIAFGPESAEEVVAGWLASPGHCANIMDPRFREMGLGYASGSKRGHLYWVQQLGSPAR